MPPRLLGCEVSGWPMIAVGLVGRGTAPPRWPRPWVTRRSSSAWRRRRCALGRRRLQGVERGQLRGAVEGRAGAGQRLLNRLEERQAAGRRRDEVADQAVDVAEEDEGVEVGVGAAVGQLVQARCALGDLLEVVVGAVDDLADVALLGQQDPGDVVARGEDGGDVGVVRRPAARPAGWRTGSAC